MADPTQSAIYAEPDYGQSRYGVIVKAATDTLDVSVSPEYTSFATVSVAGAEQLDVLVGDVSDPDVTYAELSASDTVSVSVTDAHDVTDVVLVTPSTDTVSVEFSPEARSFATVSVYDDDTIGVEVSPEARSFATVSVADDDTTSVELSAETWEFDDVVVADDDLASLNLTTEDTSFATVDVAGVDTLDVEAEGDFSSPMVVVWSPPITDDLAVEVGSSYVFGTVSVAATDTLGVATDEAYALLVPRGVGTEPSVLDPFGTPGEETYDLTLTEDRLLKAGDKLSTEEAAVEVNESYVLFVARAATDTLDVSVSDSSATQVPRAGVDTLDLSVTDTAATVRFPTSTDLLDVAVGDAYDFDAVTVYDDDTLGLSVTEDTSFATVSVADDDALAVEHSSEVSSFATVDVSGSDGVAVESVDTYALLFVTQTAPADTLSLTLTEDRDFATVEVSASDALDVEATDVYDVLLRPMTASDTLGVETQEATGFDTVDVSGSDVVDVEAGGTGEALLFKVAADTLDVKYVGNPPAPYGEAVYGDIVYGDGGDGEFSYVPDPVYVSSDVTSVGITDTVNQLVISSYIAASDTLDLSATEANATQTSRTSTDSVDVESVDEGDLLAVLPNSSDTLDAAIVDTFISLNGDPSSSDSLDVAAVDAPNLTVGLSPASDTVAVGITSAYDFATVAVVSTDTLGVAVSETTNTALPVTTADTLDVTVGREYLILTTPRVTDTLSISVDPDTSSFAQVDVEGADVLIVDTFSNEYFAPVVVSGSDTLSVGVADALTSLSGDPSSSDTLDVAAVDVSEFTDVTLRAEDNLRVLVIVTDEIASVRATVTRGDVITVSASEAYTLQGFPSATDALDVTGDEGAPASHVSISSTDTLALEVGPDRLFGTVSVYDDDTLTLTASDQRTLDSYLDVSTDVLDVSVTEAAFKAFSTSDQLDVSASESGDFATVEVRGNETLSLRAEATPSVTVSKSARGDTLGLSVEEGGTSFSQVEFATYDQLNITVDGGPEAADAQILATDTLDVSVTTGASHAVSITRGDALDVATLDATTARAFGVADTLGASISESVTLATTTRLLAAADTLDVTVSSQATRGSDTSDELGLALTEVATVVPQNAVVVTDTDALDIVTDEVSSGGTVAYSSTDSLDVALGEHRSGVLTGAVGLIEQTLRGDPTDTISGNRTSSGSMQSATQVTKSAQPSVQKMTSAGDGATGTSTATPTQHGKMTTSPVPLPMTQGNRTTEKSDPRDSTRKA